MEYYNTNRATISFHLTQEEKDQIIRESEEAGLTITDYLKDRLFENIRLGDRHGLSDITEDHNLSDIEYDWKILMEDEHVCELYEKHQGQDVAVKTTHFGEIICLIENKVDIILLKVWAESDLITQD